MLRSLFSPRVKHPQVRNHTRLQPMAQGLDRPDDPRRLQVDWSGPHQPLVTRRQDLDSPSMTASLWMSPGWLSDDDGSKLPQTGPRTAADLKIWFAQRFTVSVVLKTGSEVI
ncbi:unnamed protein product [Merluccius merluccius]